ncbi:MAG: hypothetical protein IJJ26_09925 [Victivallales bacterium]|nr:hypothetical protein [Victivallales bacterium]
MLKKKLFCTFAALGLSLAAHAVDYQWDHNPEDTKNLQAQVAKAAKEFNFVIRKIASGRLTKATTPYEKLVLVLDGDKVTFERDGADKLEAVIGQPVSWLGNQVQFQREADGRLKQSFTAEDGSREFLYTFEPDGNLKVDITLKSSKLKAPIRYSLHYNKK